MTAVSNMATFNLNNSTRSNVTLTIQPSTSGAAAPQVMSRMRYQNPTATFQMGYTDMMGDGPGRRLRKNVANVRRHVDFVSTVLNHAESRLWQYGRKQRVLQQPDILYQNTALPVHSTPETPVDCVLTKFIRTAMNKVKCPVYSVCWSPEGKRLITGCQTGEFTLWNGTAFNFETILQAHDSAIRALRWSSNEQWLLSADQEGYVKYWQPNMNNAHMFSAHKEEPVRGIAFAPTDNKFATASDDGTAKVWDFARYTEERTLRGHGSEVRCIDWHPTKGLVVTGSRDTQQPVKLWDPKSGSCLATLQEHKSSVMAVEFNRNGNWLLTGGRDHLLKMYDIRVMKEVRTFRAHKKEVISLAWHPVHEGLFASGGGDGSVVYWLVDNEKEIGLLEHAHDQAIWSMKWHPMGHILATGSNDNNTKFWARNRPGDTVEDIFGMSTTTAVGHLDKEREPRVIAAKTILDDTIMTKPDTFIPGMGLDEELYEQLNRETVSHVPDMLLVPEDLNSLSTPPIIGAKRTLIKQAPAKKAQRQFERMWNNSKGVGAASEEFSMGRQEEEGPLDIVRSHKGSLLGTPSTPSLLGKPSTGASLLGPPTPRMAPLPTPQLPPTSYNNVPPPARNDYRNDHDGGGRGGYNRNRGGEGQNWRNGPAPGSLQYGQGVNRGDTDTRAPLASPNVDLPPKNGPIIPPPGLPNVKFDKNGLPILPPGLPPHMWPMPPKGPAGPPILPTPTIPPKALSGDIDYRGPPGPSPVTAPSIGNDIDLRGRGLPPPNVPSSGLLPPPRGLPPPGQAPDSWRSGPPGPSAPIRPPPVVSSSVDPRVDPRLDPRLLPRNEPPKPASGGGAAAWMPQFEGGGLPPTGAPTPLNMNMKNLPPPMLQQQSQKSPGSGSGGGNTGRNVRHQPY